MVAISVFVVTGFIVAFLPVIDRRPESIALLVQRIKLAVELRVVTKLAGMAVRVDSSEVSTDISACRGCIGRVDERVALPVYEIARTAVFAVVAGVVLLTVVATELFTIL